MRFHKSIAIKEIFLSSLFIIAFLLLNVVPVSAATSFSMSKEEIDILNASTPEIGIKGISLDKKIYNSGDIVKGYVLLTNRSNNYTANLYFKVYVGEGFSDFYVAKRLDYSIIGPVSVDGLETKKVNFQYTLPKNISGKDMAIEIQAITKDGSVVSRMAEPMEIAGMSSQLTIASSSIRVNEKSFGLEEGPTVHRTNPGETVLFTAKIQNNSGDAITLNPKVTISAMSNVSLPVYENSSSTISLAAKETKELQIRLPLFEKADVYIGKIQFVTTQNVYVPIQEFRYIIGGAIVNISSLVSDKGSVKKGENVSVKIIYAGTPFDINPGAGAPAKNDVTFTVDLVNEYGSVVGSTQQQFNVNRPGAKEFVVNAEADAAALLASVKIAKDGQTIKTYEYKLNADYDTISLKARAIRQIEIFAGIGIVVIVLCVAWLLYIKRKKPTINSHFGATFMLFAVLLTSSFLFLPKQSLAVEGYNVYQNGGTGSADAWYNLSYTPITPLQSGPMYVGESFRVKGNLTSGSCGNKQTYVVCWDVHYGSNTYKGCRNQTTGDSLSSIDVGPFTVVAGSYEIDARFAAWEGGSTPNLADPTNTGAKAYIWGTQTFSIANVSLTPATQVVSYGTSAQLNWSDDAWGNNTCELHQDNASGALLNSITTTNTSAHTGTLLTPVVTPSGDRNYYVLSCKHNDRAPTITTSQVIVRVPYPPTSFSGSCGAPGALSYSWTMPSGYTTALLKVMDGSTVVYSGNVSGTSQQVSLSGSNEGKTFTSTLQTVSAGGQLSNTVTNSATCPNLFKYSLSNGGSISVIKNASTNVVGSTAITATLVGGTSSPRTISVSGLPAGVTSVFTVNSVVATSLIPTETGLLTLTVPPSVPAGTYPVTVTGAADDSGSVRTTTFNLIVNELSAPLNFTGAPGPCATPGIVNLSWSSVSGVTGYKLYSSDSVSGTFSQIMMSTNSTVITYGGSVPAGETRYYKITSYVGSSESTPSPVIAVKSSVACLTASCAASPSGATTGQNVTWSATAANGTSPYTYSWSGTFSDSGQSVTKSFSSAGAVNETVTITSADGQTATGSCSATITASTTITAPTPTSQTASCGGYVKFGWAAVSGATSYKIYDYAGALLTSTTNTTYTGGPFTPGSSIGYSVSAIVTGVESVKSPITLTASQACFTASCYATPNPAGLGESVRWVAVPTGGTAPYTYSWTGAITGTINTPQTNYSSTGVKIAYLAINSSDGRIATTSCTVQVNNNTPPTPGQPVVTVDTASCGGNVAFHWNAVSGATGYKVYAYDGTTVLQNSPSTSYSQSGLTPGGSFGYKITAYNSAGESVQTSVSVTASAACVPPTQPTVTVDTTSCGGNIAFHWNSVSGATGYKVYDNTGATVLQNSSITSFSRSGLTPGNSYVYKVTAYSSAGESSQASVSTTASASCPVSLSVSCWGLPNPATTGQSVTWSAAGSGGTAPYTYSWGGAVSGTSQSVTNSFSTTGSKTATVSVTSSDGITGDSSCNISVVSGSPSAPVPVEQTASCGGYVKFGWAAVSGATSYKIYDYAGALLTSTTNTTYTSGPFTPGSSIGYSVSAVNASGESAQAPITLTASGACVTYSCTGSIPANGLDCGNNNGLTTDVAYSYISSCSAVTSVNKCNFACPTGYTWNGTLCNSTAGGGTPTVSLTATPNPVDYNTASSLTWTSANATQCTSADFATGGVANNSTGVSTGNLTSAHSYTITCTGSGGSANATVVVNVNTTGDFTCEPEDPAFPGVRIKQAPVGMPVVWAAIAGPRGLPGGTYVWSGSVNRTGANLTKITTVYTTVGAKLEKLTVDGAQVQCDLGQFSVSTQPTYIEF